MRDRVPKDAEKKMAAKCEEAAGLLGLVKPLCKRAGKLSDAEQEMLFEAISKASSVLHEATSLYYSAQAQKRQRETLVRPTNERQLS